ncbi:PREDICTED: zinc finger CCCH domain-containing protein 69-like isoform X2 [Ipomoea nil]|uniref:zinc finger CCCH domain-containing protein 69-like isoform X2 n=1 Tax=Ipomoea nil TaxID=35883 RepID=UPI000900E1B3|nr:PREDICTED: zinc finger CCCH domain-containing protein 69-like isoform X2 [Ipomoea nil]
MSKRVLCKFFARRTCLKGEHCEFSHDWHDPPNNICTFYQKGICAYGSRCRYEHVRISQLQSSAPSSSVLARQHLLSSSDPLPANYETVVNGVGHGTGITTEHLNSCKRDHYPKKPAWNQKTGPRDLRDDEKNVKLKSLNAADQSICSFAAAGTCPEGEKCPHIHGDLCPSCGKHCLHPFRPQEREEHIKKCEKLQKHLEALKHSQEIDCSVCLERVLSKPTAAERKFGILSECDHPFCISCIRNWRSSSPSSGFDVNSALRACPICRKLSYFVIPSVIWYSTKEEKQEILTSYKTKLRSIDCKHFDFGSGTCPFGSSCFYKHAYRDGRLEEVVLRQLGFDDGTTIIALRLP